MHTNPDRAILLTSVLLLTAGSQLAAQEFPAKPVRAVVPFNAGGGLDLLARSMAPPFSRALGQNVIIDNRPGAGTVIGTEIVARAPADGYTLLYIANSFTINPALRGKLPYDTMKGFTAVARVAMTPNVFAAHPSLPARNIEELVALAGTRPGQVTYATSGVGTAQNLAGEMLNVAGKIDMTHIPYTGAGLAIPAVIGGHTTVLIGTLAATAPHLANGRLRGLAITSAERVELVKNLPTVAESGYPGYEAVVWYGLVAPAGTPRTAISRFNTAISTTIKQISESLDKQGMFPALMNAEEFDAYIRAELSRNEKIARLANMRAE